MAPLQRLLQLVRHLSSVAISTAPSTTRSSSSSSSLDASTPSTDLFQWLQGQLWGCGPAAFAEDLLPAVKLLGSKTPQTMRKEWRLEDIQVLLSLLRQALNQGGWSGNDNAELVSLCLELFTRWTSAVSGNAPGQEGREMEEGDTMALQQELVHSGARLGSEAVYQILPVSAANDSSKIGQMPPHPFISVIVLQVLHLWVLAGRLRACPLPEVVDHLCALLVWPPAIDCILLQQHREGRGGGGGGGGGGNPSAWKALLKAMLLDLTEEDASTLSATDVEFRLVKTCLQVVARSPHLWVWDSFMDTLMQLPEDEEEEADGVLWPADSIGWRREQATHVMLEALEPATVVPGTSWQERGMASVGAVALLSGRFDDDRLWKKFLLFLKEVMRQSGGRRRSGTGQLIMEGEEEDLGTARVGLCRALIHLGLSNFCARSFEGESGAWTREWGICLSTLLRLSLEDVVTASSTNSVGGPAKEKDANLLARSLCEKCLSPVSVVGGKSNKQELARAVTALFKASDALGQTEAFSILRSYARSLATTHTPPTTMGTTSTTRRMADGESSSLGLVLILQVCLVLADPASAAIASTEQVIWVLEVLETVAGLLMVGPASGLAAAADAAAFPSSPAPLQGVLLAASSNLQAVLEDDGEEAWLKEARDWVIRTLDRRRQALRKGQVAAGATTKSQAQQQEENRMAYLTHLAFALCIQTRRPAPHQYVADLTKVLLEEVLKPCSSSSSSLSSSLSKGAAAAAAPTVISAQVHRCLRSLVSNASLLAYRAGRKEHWDEARRRITAAYVHVALESYPATTAFQDLAYCVGAAIGATPTEGDSAGQALVLHCLRLIQDRVLVLCRGGDNGGGGGGDKPEVLHDPAIRELVKLLFQTLIVCPPAVLEKALRSLGQDFLLQGLEGRPQTRLAVMRLLKSVVFGGQVETMRQSRLAKWYLGLVHEEAALTSRESAGGGGAGGGGAAAETTTSFF